MKSALHQTEWGCSRDDSRHAEIIRCERPETDDYGPAGEVYWIIKWDDGGVSDPYLRLWIAKEDLAVSPINPKGPVTRETLAEVDGFDWS